MKTLKLVALILLFAINYGCSNDSDINMNQESEMNAVTAKTILNTSELSGFADSIVLDNFTSDESGKSARKSDCYISDSDGAITTITFNDCEIDGIESVNGIIRAEYEIEGNAIVIKMDYLDLTIGDTQLSGSRELYFRLDGEMDETSISVESDVQIGLEDGTLVLEEGSRIIRYETNTDDVQKISVDGAWSVTVNGSAFDIEIEENLETLLPCTYIGKGLLLISENEATASVDFGEGECDDVALFTYPNGNTEEISLRD